MGESRGQMEARLRREGRWDAFGARLKELKAEGMTGTEAKAQAIEEFSEPLPRTDDDAGRVPAEVFQGKVSTAQAEVLWVKDHIGVTGVLPEDAPSSGAWGLYHRVMSEPANQTTFWTKIYPKIFPKTVAAEPAGPGGALAEDDNTDDLTELCDYLLKLKEKIEAESEAESAPNWAGNGRGGVGLGV